MYIYIYIMYIYTYIYIYMCVCVFLYVFGGTQNLTEGSWGLLVLTRFGDNNGMFSRQAAAFVVQGFSYGPLF